MQRLSVGGSGHCQYARHSAVFGEQNVGHYIVTDEDAIANVKVSDFVTHNLKGIGRRLSKIDIYFGLCTKLAFYCGHGYFSYTSRGEMGEVFLIMPNSNI